MTPTQLPSDYLQLLRTQGLADEAYKWELLRQQIGRPNLNAPDFGAEVQSLDYANLIYGQTSLAVLSTLAKERPEDLRSLLRDLFTGSAPLTDRLAAYKERADTAFAKTRGDTERTSHQDERTAATLLFFYDPAHYTLYKNSAYKKFCALLDLNSKPAGQKYAHYLELLKDFIAEHVAPNAELLATYRELVPDADTLDPNNLLLAQDMLWRVLEQGTDSKAKAYKERYWFVGASSDHTDHTEKFLSEGIWRSGYAIDQLPSLDEIEVGDPIAIKSTFTTKKELPFDSNGQVVSTMRIKAIGEVTERIDEQTFAVDWDTDFEAKDWYFYTYQGTLWQVEPTTWKSQALVDFAFYSKPQAYDRFMQDPFWADRFGDSSGKPSNQSTHPLNQILYGPPGTGKTYRTRQLACEICDGQSYDDAERETVRKRYKELVDDDRIAFVTFHPSMSYEDFVEGIKPETTDEGQVTYTITPGIFYRQAVEAFAGQDESKVTSAASYSQRIDTYFDQVQQQLESTRQVAITSRSGGELFITGITSQGNLSIQHKHGDHSFTVSRDRLERLFVGVEDWNNLKNLDQEFRAVIGGSNSSAMWAVGNAVLQQTAASVQHATEKISPEAKRAAFRSALRATNTAASPDKSVGVSPPKPHVLIIDEINRGNTPAIFGELITLLEDDKRLGADEQLTVTLPYSKEPFGVPANLHLIGTMNTADRSVEALDAALRRRFEFEEVAPDPQVLAKAGTLPKGNLPLLDGSSLSLSDFLTLLNARITALRDRDHAIGHAPFLKVDSAASFQRVLAKAVIPLLREYFYGDDAQLARILGPGFVQRIDDDVVFANSDEDDLDLPTRYTLIDPITVAFDLAAALRKGGFLTDVPLA